MKKSILSFLLVLFCIFITSCSENTEISSQYSSRTPIFPSDETAATEDSSKETNPISSGHTTIASSSKITKYSSVLSKKASSKVNVSSKPQKEIVQLTIIPGWTVKNIAAALEKNKICSADDFLKAVNNGDFSAYPLVNQITNKEKRCYRLEGYLYPDTYEFYTNSEPTAVIKKILSNTEKKINGKYSYSGMTADQIITLASLIEKESGGGQYRKQVSSVIHNRLDKKMRLQLDCTVHYLNSLDPADTQKYRFYYNTYNKTAEYQCPGLPAGPICSPSAKSLEAAVNPDKSDYLYFGSREDGTYYFQTEEEYIAANTSSKTE